MKKSIFKKPLIFSLALALAFSSGASAYAAEHENAKPKNGTTMDEPFAKGTADSNSFRIPALLTLDSGRVVAAADARWNSTVDGGGFDTIVSYSDDNGKNWNYSFVNYLGDNGNKYDGKNSSCFIDPALATDGKKVWMLCDLYPYGVALNGDKETTPQRESGFDSNGNLLLSNDNHGSYNYHLNLKDLKIYNNETNEVINDYTVDAYFNIKNADGTLDTNLFFKDSPYKVQRTSYLYLVSSEDGGETFSAPQLLPLKNNTEKAYLVGPGRGLYTKNGTIIFPCYKHNGGIEYTSFVYSKDNGKTWERSTDAPTTSKSSESAVIELPNGNLRFFYRHHSNVKLKYIDVEFSEDTLTYNWKKEVQTDVIVNSATQMSAIIYSSPINNKTTLLLSCPAGPGGNGSTNTAGGPGQARVNGRIFVGLIDDNAENTIEWLEPMKVGADGSEFMYSCLTELTKDGNNKTNGDIALLYEDHQNKWGSGDDYYFTMTYKTYNLSDVIPNAYVGSFAFKEQLQKAEAISEERYTKSSYKKLAEIITKAKEGLANKEPKEKLEEYAKELETAMASLKKRGSIAKANAALNKAKEKIAEENKYTAASMKAVKDAVVRLNSATIDNSEIDEDQMADLIKQVEEAINKLVLKSNSGSGSGGSSGGGGGYYPSVPSTPSDNKPEEKKNEDTAKKPETQKPAEDKKTSSELDIKPDETPKGNAVKKALSLPSSKKLIDLKTLKGLNKSSVKAVNLVQNKAKINVSITSDALSELAAKKITSFAIKGKNFTVNLSTKNIKALSKLKGKQITLKVNKLKSGKFSVNISIDGKKLSAKEIAKLKIQVK